MGGGVGGGGAFEYCTLLIFVIVYSQRSTHASTPSTATPTARQQQEKFILIKNKHLKKILCSINYISYI